MPALQLHEGRHKEGTGDWDHAMQALPKEAAATPPRIEQLKENMRPAAYNVEASALHFIKPTKVPAHPLHIIIAVMPRKRIALLTCEA